MRHIGDGSRVLEKTAGELDRGERSDYIGGKFQAHYTFRVVLLEPNVEGEGTGAEAGAGIEEPDQFGDLITR